MLTPAPPPVAVLPEFKSDKIMGAIIIVLGALSFFDGLIALTFSSFFAPIEHVLKLEASKAPANDLSPVVPFVPLASIFSALGWFTVIVAILQIASGFGIMKSIQKAMYFAILVGALSFVGGRHEILVGIFMQLYAILRLHGNVGPRPI